MLFSDDELTPQKQPKKPRDLSNFSVDDLTAYITALEAEKARAEVEMTKKKAYKDTVGGFFKTTGEKE